ncbi:hypothetical protein [Sphingomonas sp. G-3-2-10]|uniref:hypothetical protein n=1 Tax=Sphingomonas sp. G-3-2-10 TaxID=2728838 RepID=UPI00146A9E6F|nr:hypothetical protein [Sphingomonas sp. G-3-2-10]NML06211.1 hypothetical protein [Sphingomonas sp. G-3-2-10]
MRMILTGLGLMTLAACGAVPANQTAGAVDPSTAFILAQLKPVAWSGEIDGKPASRNWQPANVSLAAGNWRWSETSEENGAKLPADISMAPRDLVTPATVERTVDFWQIRFECRAPGCITVKGKDGEKRADSATWNFTDQEIATRVARGANGLLIEQGARPREK